MITFCHSWDIIGCSFFPVKLVVEELIVNAQLV